MTAAILADTLPFCSIPLTQGLFAIVDKDDYERISEHKWFAKKDDKYGKITWYAARSDYSAGKCKTVFMHNEILGGLYVDHKNHNGLDNRRCNLRLCTQRQNCQNREPRRNRITKYKGITYYKNRTGAKKWAARITVNGKKIWLGIYETEIEAAQAYDLAAIENFGQFAKINEYTKEELENGKL